MPGKGEGPIPPEQNWGRLDGRILEVLGSVTLVAGGVALERLTKQDMAGTLMATLGIAGVYDVLRRVRQ